MKNYQFAEKIRELGYHASEWGDRVEVYLHGDYVCTFHLCEVMKRFKSGSPIYIVPQDLLSLLEEYGDL